MHVDHGLAAGSAHWAQFCRDRCADLGLTIQVLKVNGAAPTGQSPEAWARRLRYTALQGCMCEGDVLLTAHHRDDQAETLLLQLLRGAGPHGLSAMPAVRPFGTGWLARPQLDFSRAQLLVYARQHALSWIDDPSNQDLAFDRNFVRHRVMPLIRERWPGCARTLSRASEWQRQSVEILDARAVEDMQDVVGNTAKRLSVTGLTGLDPVRRRNVLRYWIKGSGLPVPSAVQLEHIISDVFERRARSHTTGILAGGHCASLSRPTLCHTAITRPRPRLGHGLASGRAAASRRWPSECGRRPR